VASKVRMVRLVSGFITGYECILLIVSVGVEYPALLSTVGCAGVVGFILRLKAQVFSLISYKSRDGAIDNHDAAIEAVESDSGRSPTDEGYVTSVLILKSLSHRAMSFPTFQRSPSVTHIHIIFILIAFGRKAFSTSLLWDRSTSTQSESSTNRDPTREFSETSDRGFP